MTENLDELRARADHVGTDQIDEAIAVNEAILRLEAGELVATRRLALALIKIGDVDRADEIIDEALVLHPDDEILTRRANDVVVARRRAARELATSGERRSRGGVSVASTWIKAVHYDGTGWTERPGTEMWLSDPGQRSPSGERLYTASGEPRGRPSWRVGEQAGIYFGGTQRVPFLVEVTRRPTFDTAFVQAADWAEEDDGERWPWVTWVRVLIAVKVAAAPTLNELGIHPSSMQQRARLRTDATIHGRLVQALEAVS